MVSTGAIVDDVSGNLITTGQTLQTQITSNDTDITNLSSNLVTTGQTLTTNIDTVATNLVTTGQTLTSEINTVSGLIPATVVDGAGVTGYTARWFDGNTLTTGALYDNGTRVGIGTNAPDYALDVAGNAGFNEYIYHNGDADTYIQFDTDEINFVVGAAHMIYLNEGGAGAQADKVTINNNLADVDFQVKGDNDANLFRTDAANDRVGIGTDAPDYTLHIAGTVGIDSYIYHNGDSDTYLKFDTNEVNLVAGNWSALKLDKSTGKIQLNNTNADLDLQVMADDGEVILHTDAGTNRVGIGTDAPGSLLVVAGGDLQILSVDPGPGTSNPTDGRLLFDKVFDNSGEATANKIVLYDDGGVGPQWKGGIGVSHHDIDFYSGENFRFWTGHGSTTEGDNRFTILTDGKH